MKLKQFLDENDAWGKKIRCISDPATHYYEFYFIAPSAVNGTEYLHGKAVDAQGDVSFVKYTLENEYGWQFYKEPKKTVRKYLWVFSYSYGRAVLTDVFQTEESVKNLANSEQYTKVQPEIYIDVEVEE